MTTEVKVPDIGDFKNVPVISILVKVGDTVAKEDPLLELESDKATMEVPSPEAGKVVEIKVAEGTTVEINTVVAVIGEAGSQPAASGSAGSGVTVDVAKEAKATAVANLLLRKGVAPERVELGYGLVKWPSVKPEPRVEVRWKTE